MSQVQQLPRQETLWGERPAERWKERFQQHEASLLAELFRANGREDMVQTATPPGYVYERVDTIPWLSDDAHGPIMQIAAHPGDGPDFFYATYLQMAAHHNEYHEIILTDGERGVDGWLPERTRQVRIREAYAGAEIVGSTLHLLGYPDGCLSSLAEKEQAQLITTLASMIGEIQPRLLVVHPPKNDHPDHASAFLLTLAALELHAQAGGRAPTLLMHDVEFGLQQESLWTPPMIDLHAHVYPMHSPDFLVDISTTHQTAQRALHAHTTQMADPVSGQPKVYAHLIDALAHVRGLQLMEEGMAQVPRGQGFSHVVIPGVTSEENSLLPRLAAGSVYQRTNEARAWQDDPSTLRLSYSVANTMGGVL